MWGHHNRRCRLRFEPLEPRCLLAGMPVITELMAVNGGTLDDEDRESSDWIEIHNPTSEAIELQGWHLTDEPDELTKWEFPDVTLSANDYLVVFASGKDRAVPGRPLHTDFKLAGGGEYLALVAPDGLTVASQFAPAYPRQYEDVSYGLLQEGRTFFLPDGAEMTYLVPEAGDAAFENTWMNAEFDDSAWPAISQESRLLITEAGTEDPDFVEIQNVSNRVVGASGCVVAVNNSRAYNVNHVNDGLWSLPPLIAPGETLYRTDKPDDNYWGFDIFWRTTGAGWVMIVDDEGNVADFVAWGYLDEHLAELDVTINGHRITSENLWEGPPVAAGGAPSNSLQRGGTADHNTNADWTFIAPQSIGQRNDGLEAPFDAGISSGLGFDVAATGLDGTFRFDLAEAMHGQNASLWLRAPLQIEDPAVLDTLQLDVRYNDGLVAYLNGEPVAALNAPDVPHWNSTATEPRSVAESKSTVPIDLTAYLDLLRPGENTLAIHALNHTAADDNFLIVPEVLGTSEQYFPQPTPGKANVEGMVPWGPVVVDVTENPTPPADGQDLVITARAIPTLSPIGWLAMDYRVMYGAEVTVPMIDDGNGPDAVAGDGVYSAVIPHTAYAPGEMVRWSVTANDTSGRGSRVPHFADPLESPEYLGTVVVDTATADSQLPVLHWFIENPTAANNRNGTRASVFYLDEFYDNIRVDLHGQSSAGFPKKSYDFDFNRGNRFKFAEDQGRVKDFNLLTNWADKAKVRNTLAYEVYRDAAATHHVAFPIRVQQNGGFFSTADWVEDGDDRYLERLGLDPNGALYKMYNRLENTGGGEKKTRRWEGKGDLQALINGLNLSGDARTRFVFDNVDVAATVNFLAATVIMDTIDYGHKNYYVYRDTNGSGRWQITPWDVDLSFGRNWTSAQHYYDDRVYTTNPLFIHHDNRLMRVFFQVPLLREMYLRRVRTLMDELLQPADTPIADRYLEGRIDELAALIDPHYDQDPRLGSDDADLDYQRWNSWGNNDDIRRAVEELKTVYLPARRRFLFETQSVDNGGEIPLAQIDLAELPAQQRKIEFGRIEFSPASGNQDQEYIELVNRNDFAVDISGWQLSGGVRTILPGGTVIGAGKTLYLTPDVAAFRSRTISPRGNQSLFVQPYDGHLSSFGETITLSDKGGRVIAEVDYEGNPSPQQLHLRITEVNYNPHDADTAAGELPVDHNEFEYIELLNTSQHQTLDLRGVRFTGGVTFDFTDSAVRDLAPGQRMVVVRNEPAFRSRYGDGPSVAGEFVGGLLNDGERIKLEDPNNDTIADFDYNDGEPWPGRADGKGASLQIVDRAGDYDRPTNWRSSAQFGGTPGERLATEPGVVINEVLTNTDPPEVDAIELLNTTGDPIDVGGWYLSDSWGWASSTNNGDYRKFRIPDGTTIPAGGHVVFYEGHYEGGELAFDPAVEFGGVGQQDFALNGDRGDHVWLMEADEAGRLTRFVDHVSFPAAATGATLGRRPDATGMIWPMTDNTLGEANAEAQFGPIVVGEVMYHPADGGHEFIELYNSGSATVPLYDPGHPANAWKIDGISFDFPPGAEMLPGSVALVVPIGPEAFRAAYEVPVGVPIFGPYRGALDNAGETVQLLRPNTPTKDDPPVIPYLLVDQVVYSPDGDWPAAADGQGDSLQRLDAAQFAGDPGNWAADVPTAGVVPFEPVPHVVDRRVFYNNSSFDGSEPGVSEADDDAIATDKTALLPGQTATFANYTSFDAGINGILVDVAHPAAALSDSDFHFRIGNSDDPASWPLAPAPANFALREGAGIGGSDRVMITWGDYAILNGWLEVTLVGQRLGLPGDDVFYIGNAAGEAGNSTSDAQVTTTDVLLARNNPRNFLNPAAVDFPYDYNRDGRVTTTDLLLARNNQTNFLTRLRLLDLSQANAQERPPSAEAIDQLLAAE